MSPCLCVSVSLCLVCVSAEGFTCGTQKLKIQLATTKRTSRCTMSPMPSAACSPLSRGAPESPLRCSFSICWAVAVCMHAKGGCACMHAKGPVQMIEMMPAFELTYQRRTRACSAVLMRELLHVAPSQLCALWSSHSHSSSYSSRSHSRNAIHGQMVSAKRRQPRETAADAHVC